MVVTYNALEFVQRCLASVKARTRVPYELIVVDNLSEEPVRAWLSEQRDAGVIHKLFLNDENKLWGPGVNQGMAEADPRSPYLLLLNPDTEALLDDWLDQLLALLESDDRIGIVGPEQIYLPTGPVFGGVDGHCLLMRRAVYEATGGIDEQFPWWGGGMKFNAAAWAAGWRFAICEEPVLAHYEGRSNAERDDPVDAVIPDYEEMLRSVGITPRPETWLDRWRWKRTKARRKDKRRELRARVKAVVGEA